MSHIETQFRSTPVTLITEERLNHYDIDKSREELRAAAQAFNKFLDEDEEYQEWLTAKEKEDLDAQMKEDFKYAQIVIHFETFRNFCREMKYDRNTLIEIKYILDEIRVPKDAQISIVPVRQKGISTVYQFCWETNIIWEIDVLDGKAVRWIEKFYKKIH
jgi:hypothetical protein